MARRAGRKGDYLAADDYTGFTKFRSQLSYDYWGALTEKPLLRNLQEISSPLDDPAPVPDFRGPAYEISTDCVGELTPIFVGNTTVLTNLNNAANAALNLSPGIGDMQIGCTFRVY